VISTIPAVADRVIDEALTHGPIDVLINNAGIEIVGQVAEQDPDDLRAVIGVNLEVPITLAHHVLPHMLERGSGRIVNISSMASVVSSPGWATYSASKAGLSSFSRSLKTELAGTGVGVTVVEIGFVQTDMLDDLRSNDFVRPASIATSASASPASWRPTRSRRRSPPQSRRNAATSDYRSAASQCR
jgi:short-subunit dehydrogenase